MSEDTQREVEAWLNKQGYPLEFRVAHALKEVGFAVAQGDHLPDPSSGKFREVDVIADLFSMTQGVLFRLSVIVECKYAPQPWVLFDSSGYLDWRSTICTSPARELVWTWWQRQSKLDCSLFNLPFSSGHGGCVANVGRSSQKGPPKDLLFQAVQAAATHAVSYVELQRPVKGERFEIPQSAGLAVPLVVVDGDLFRGVFNSHSGKIEVEPTDAHVILWSGASSGPHAVPVWVVRASAVKEIASELFSGMTDFTKFAKETLPMFKESQAARSLEPLGLGMAHEFPIGFLAEFDERGA